MRKQAEHFAKFFEEVAGNPYRLRNFANCCDRFRIRTRRKDQLVRGPPVEEQIPHFAQESRMNLKVSGGFAAPTGLAAELSASAAALAQSASRMQQFPAAQIIRGSITSLRNNTIEGNQFNTLPAFSTSLK
jgi:hypothetical protein